MSGIIFITVNLYLCFCSSNLFIILSMAKKDAVISNGQLNSQII
jgi:hypothetical protein